MLMFGLLIILPIVFIVMLWKTPYKSKLEWIFSALLTTALIVWLFQAGNWSWTGYYIRYLILVIFIVSLVISWRKVRELPFTTKYARSQKFSLGFTFLLFLLFAMYNGFVLSSYTTSDEAIELAFPLKEGTYYVGQGGNHEQMNYHQAYEPQQYALDILKINQLGFRAKGLQPKELEKYEIFDDTIYSPCNGKVVGVENELADLVPPDTDPENATGNHVALTCENTDATIYLAHMQNGSVKVKEDEKLVEGEAIGKVGNSGNTSEPHLHIHAEKDGVGIPLRFDKKFLVRNSLVR